MEHFDDMITSSCYSLTIYTGLWFGARRDPHVPTHIPHPHPPPFPIPTHPHPHRPPTTTHHHPLPPPPPTHHHAFPPPPPTPSLPHPQFVIIAATDVLVLKPRAMSTHSAEYSGVSNKCMVRVQYFLQMI